eukprot:6566968-Heterocapsa_arctica.AAC.1
MRMLSRQPSHGGQTILELGAFCGLCSRSAAESARRETRSRAVRVPTGPFNKPTCQAAITSLGRGAATSAMPTYHRPR